MIIIQLPELVKKPVVLGKQNDQIERKKFFSSKAAKPSEAKCVAAENK